MVLAVTQIIQSGNLLSAQREMWDSLSGDEEGEYESSPKRRRRKSGTGMEKGVRRRRTRRIKVKRKRTLDPNDIPQFGTEYVLDEEDSDSIDLGGDEIKGENKGLVKSLLKQVRPGMDLSKVVLPTFILEPRSFLEKMTDYFAHIDLLAKVTTYDDPLDRILNLTRWYLSGFYLGPKGVKKPYNPILGEIFRCRWDHPPTPELPFESQTLFYAEQVSHHPPISAFYITNRKVGFVINFAIRFKSRFNITHVLAILHGSAKIHLLNRNEEYTIDFPKAKASGWFTTLKSEIVDKVTISCESTGCSTEIKFKSKPLVGGTYNSLKGEIKKSGTVRYTLEGKWNDRIDYTDVVSGSNHELWDTYGKRKTLIPYKKPPLEDQLDTESVKMWAKVTQAIIDQDQHAATDEKYVLEQKQREDKIERDAAGTEWELHNFVQNNPDVTIPDFTYKYMNLNPFDWDTEAFDIEENGGVIRTVTKAELDAAMGRGGGGGGGGHHSSGWTSSDDGGEGTSSRAYNGGDDLTYEYTDESYSASDLGAAYDLREAEYTEITEKLRTLRQSHDDTKVSSSSVMETVTALQEDLKAASKAERKLRREVNSLKSTVAALEEDAQPESWFSPYFLFRMFTLFWLFYISWAQFSNLPGVYWLFGDATE